VAGGTGAAAAAGFNSGMLLANDTSALGLFLHVRCAVFARCGGAPSTEVGRCSLTLSNPTNESTWN
jgi:hypothetical protein